MKTKIDLIQTSDCIYWPWAFDHVTVNCEGREIFSILGKCYSSYKSGPNLCLLADVAGEFWGPGYYGLSSCRFLGWTGGTDDL